ncbi:MAG: 50S ribosomal protein L25/general stress protein Ctc [Bacteroidota bacterium]
MKFLTVQGDLRKELGKTSSHALRIARKVPCVLYGGGEEENIHFIVDEEAFKKAYITPEVFVIDLKIEKKEYKAVIKEIQFHPVTDRVIHVDFYQVFEDKPFSIKMPINIVGDSVGVKQGGKLMIKMRKIRVFGLLADIPSKLDVDITKLQIGQSIKIPSLSYDNLEIQEPKNAVVCTVKTVRAAVKVEAAVPGAPETEGEEASAEEGAEGKSEE